MSIINESERSIKIMYRVVTLYKLKDENIGISACQFKIKEQATRLASARKQMIHRGYISSEVYPLIIINNMHEHLIFYREFFIRKTDDLNILILDSRNEYSKFNIYDFDDMLESIDFVDKILLNEQELSNDG